MNLLMLFLCICVALASLVPQQMLVSSSESPNDLYNMQQLINRKNEMLRTVINNSNVDNGKENTIEGIKNFIKEGDLNKINGLQNIINGSRNSINGNSNDVNGHSNNIIDSSNNKVYGNGNSIQSLPMPKVIPPSDAYVKPVLPIKDDSPSNSKKTQVDQESDSSKIIESNLSNQFDKFIVIGYLLVALLILQ